MFYDRKIRYLDYCRFGERVRSGGFAKTEVRDDSFTINLILKGAPPVNIASAEIYLCGTDKEAVLGRITIENGQGGFQHKCGIKNGIGGTGIQYDELSGIRIPLGENGEISGRWNISKESLQEKEHEITAAVKEEMRETKEESCSETEKIPLEKERELTEQYQKRIYVWPEQRQERKPENRGWRGKAVWESENSGSQEKSTEEPENQGQQEKLAGEAEEPENREQQEKLAGGAEELENREQQEKAVEEPEKMERQGNPAGGIGQRADERRQPETMALLEDKWLQLSAIYPHIKPFRDEREYLSISPADFVLFSAESYRAVNNSFLLHGYYNYRHLILTRVEKRGEILYYVGVPGNYFDREKQVAVMFGFESFECAEEPAQNADFGYYMMKVQL